MTKKKDMEGLMRLVATLDDRARLKLIERYASEIGLMRAWGMAEALVPAIDERYLKSIADRASAVACMDEEDFYRCDNRDECGRYIYPNECAGM